MNYNAKNDKVLMKQTKNQSTYSFAGQKLTTLFSIGFLLKLFVLTLLLYKTLAGCCMSIASQFRVLNEFGPKRWVFIQEFSLFV